MQKPKLLVYVKENQLRFMAKHTMIMMSDSDKST